MRRTAQLYFKMHFKCIYWLSIHCIWHPFFQRWLECFRFAGETRTVENKEGNPLTMKLLLHIQRPEIIKPPVPHHRVISKRIASKGHCIAFYRRNPHIAFYLFVCFSFSYKLKFHTLKRFTLYYPAKLMGKPKMVAACWAQLQFFFHVPLKWTRNSLEF